MYICGAPVLGINVQLLVRLCINGLGAITSARAHEAGVVA